MAVLFMTLFVNRTGDESKFYKEGAHKTQLLNYDETFSSESETKLFDCIKIRWSPPDGPTLPRWSRQPPSSLSLSLSLAALSTAAVSEPSPVLRHHGKQRPRACCTCIDKAHLVRFLP